MKEKIMYIKTVYDLIEYSKNHPNYEYTYYDGDWIVYDDKDNLIDEKEVKLNSIMMRQLADMNVISFKGYVISHRAVRRYCVDENFEEKIADERNAYDVIMYAYWKFKEQYPEFVRITMQE